MNDSNQIYQPTPALAGVMQNVLKLDFNSWITWHYTQELGKTKSFSPRHEDILKFSNGKAPIFNLDDVRIPQKYYRERNNMRGANPGDVWQFSHVHYSNPNRQNHPTQKPEGIIERIVLTSSNRGDKVLDSFSGSCTSLRVCQQLERSALGFELNPECVELRKKRLAEPFTGFDSIDPRIERVPNDLRDAKLREDYLKNHENTIQDFQNVVSEKYGASVMQRSKKNNIHATLFD